MGGSKRRRSRRGKGLSDMVAVLLETVGAETSKAVESRRGSHLVCVSCPGCCNFLSTLQDRWLSLTDHAARPVRVASALLTIGKTTAVHSQTLDS